MLCFTYFHVMPEFIEFLFSFGYQSHAQDPYFSSFRQRTCLSVLNQTFSIPELAWSGNELQMCYNMKSVERAGSDLDDWSIRPCAVHHTFDAKTTRASWIIIKGNDEVKNRVEEAAETRCHDGIPAFDTLDRAFAASLATHLVLCDWAAEQWRWYINNLEERFQNTSRRTLTALVNLPSSPVTARDDFEMQPRSNTQKTNGSFAARISRTQTMLTEKLSISSPKQPKSPVQRTYTDPESGFTQPLPPHITLKEDPNSMEEQPQPQPEPTFENSEEQDFSFAKLQKIQHIEEKAHEAVLIIRMNNSIIRQIKQYYDTISNSKYFPQNIAEPCQCDLEQFELRINGILNDLEMQILRLDTLLRLLGDRKTLVLQIIQSIEENAKLNHDSQLHSILEFQNTETNKQSTRSMMSMTEDMNDIARKTKIETVSMKVITVVTLFFLPGTFISVSRLS